MTSRRWCFTLNNPTEDEFGKVLTALEWKQKIIKFGICQLEAGNGDETVHLQGYLETTMPLKLSTIKSKLDTNRVHLEKAQGTKQQNIDYCSKDDTKLEGPWSFGDPNQHQGSRSDLKAVADDIKAGKSLKEIAEEHPVEFIKYGGGIQKTKNILDDHKIRDHVDVIVHCGPTNTGKTTKVWTDEQHVYALPVKDPKQSTWFDNYNGEDTLLIDDFYGRDFIWGSFLKILDKFPIQVAVKNAQVWAKWTKVYITSNAEPWVWYRHSKNTKNDQSAFFRRVTKIRHFKKDFTFDETDGPQYLLDLDVKTLQDGTEQLPDGFGWEETKEILQEVHKKFAAKNNVFDSMMEVEKNSNSNIQQNQESDSDDDIVVNNKH